MKRFLPLLILTGLLFGQDTTIVLENGRTLKGTIVSETDSTYRIMGESWRVTDGVYEVFNTFINISKNETVEEKELFSQGVLHLKSGESFEGTFHEILGRDILFKAVGDTTMKKFPIWNVETIETKNWGELHYPFDIPTKQEYPSKGWSRSSSYGFLSEKIPLSFFDVSLLYNIGGHSELYGTFTSYIFGGGIGLGYKYYTINKSKNLMYISAGMAKYFFGEFSPDVSGFSIATGVSKYKGEKTTVVKKPRFVFASNGVSKYKSFLNIGISIYYISSKSYSRERENEFGIAPFINLERRW